MKSDFVFDTNVLISGYLWKGKARDAVKCAKSTNFKLLICKESINELARVLSQKFELDASEIYQIIVDIYSFSQVISISSKENPVKVDLSDNLFINLAIDGNSKVIVSGDSHLLKLKNFKGIEIITISEFLKHYKE